MLSDITLFISSLALITLGADWTLESSEKIGRFFGLSPFALGVLIVGLGTSLPELFVTHIAQSQNAQGLALGNIIGSNVANVFLILGLSALIHPISFHNSSINTDLIIHLIITSIFGLCLMSSRVDMFYGALLFAPFIIFVTFHLKKDKRQGESKFSTSSKIDLKESSKQGKKIKLLDLGQFIAGLSLLYVCGDLIVQSAQNLASFFGLSEYALSALLVAFGTSLPELVTSLIACIKKKSTDLILGNIIGSNIFNLSFVLGTLGLIYGDVKMGEGKSLINEWTALMVASVLFLILLRIRASLDRRLGALFLLFYFFFIFTWIQSSPYEEGTLSWVNSRQI